MSSMVWHPYKYLVKAVHRAFFPVFALLETPMHATGVQVVAQRKLLYLEKLFAALLLAAPRLKGQLENKILQVKARMEMGKNDIVAQEKAKKLYLLLEGLSSLLFFFIPAVFRVGYLCRCCTWEGRAMGSGSKAKQVLEDILILLVHILQQKCGKNEYIRTLSVALITWLPYMSRIPAVCFAEESCEALLSRMSHRCEVYRHLHGFDDTFNLFLTLPLPSKVPKQTRGCLKLGLVSLFASRIRKIVFSEGELPFAPTVGTKQMHSVFVNTFPDNMVPFPVPLQRTGGVERLHQAMLHALKTLLSKVTVSPEMEKILKDNVPVRSSHEADEYKQGFDLVKKPRPSPPPKPVRKKLMPKPRASRVFNCLICAISFKK